MSTPTVFLDRDGTINIEKNYLYRIKDWEWIPGAMEAIKLFNEKGFFVVVITNQSGIARGLYSEEDVDSLHNFVSQQIRSYGGKIDKYYYCPHYPNHEEGNCYCRKPLPGMILDASRDLDIDLNRSWIVGDKVSDIQAGKNLNLRNILVLTGHGEKEKDLLSNENQVVCNNILEAAHFVLSASNNLEI